MDRLNMGWKEIRHQYFRFYSILIKVTFKGGMVGEDENLYIVIISSDPMKERGDLDFSVWS